MVLRHGSQVATWGLRKPGYRLCKGPLTWHGVVSSWTEQELLLQQLWGPLAPAPSRTLTHLPCGASSAAACTASPP